MRSGIKISILFLVAAVSTFRPVAAQPRFVFEHYSSLEGLPHNSISDIHQDRDGFVWICTWYGLSRFDGYRFKNFLTLPGDSSPVSHNRFLGIDEDPNGYLWLRTYDNSLYLFDPRVETFRRIPPATDKYRSGNFKVDRMVCSGGYTWVVVSGEGLMRVRVDSLDSSVIEVQDYFSSPHVGRNITLLQPLARGGVTVVSELGAVMLVPDADDIVLLPLLREQGIECVAESRDMLYVGTAQRVVAIDKPSNRRTEIEIGDRITALALSPKQDVLWIGTARKGLFGYDVASSRVWSPCVFTQRVRSLVADSHGTLWITTPQAGIMRFDPERRNCKEFRQPMRTVPYYVDTLTRVVEHNDVVWIKMNRYGFGYYDRETDSIEPLPTNDNHISNGVTCFEIDRSDVMWLSSSMRGLEKITLIEPKASVFRPHGTLSNLATSEIRALMFDSKGNMWTANKAGELFCYDSADRQRHCFCSSGSEKWGMVYCLKEDSKGNIWCGTKGDGAVKLTPVGDGFRATHFRHNVADRYSIGGNNIYSIEEDVAGRIWFGAYDGGLSMLSDERLQRFLTVDNSFPNYPIEQGSRIRYLCSMSDGRMLAASVEGLIIFDPQTEAENIRFELVRKIPGDSTSLGNNDIIHILCDSTGRIWLSTFGGGLNLMELSDNGQEIRFRVFSTDNGLASNIVFSAAEDATGRIWIATENGLSSLDPQSGAIHNYSRYDGIPHAIFSEATAATAPDGRVLFGSTNYLYVLSPEKMTSLQEQTNLHFTNLEIDNREVPIGADSPLQCAISQAQEIILPYDYSIFRIEYASLNFKMQPRLGYRYMLEGYDSDWNNVGKVRSASYSNVPRGRYTFRVRSVLDDRTLPDEGISIALVIRPAPWQRWWAYMIYGTVSLLLLYAVLKTLYTMLALRQRVRLEERMTDMKLRFFTNISHELRTPLTLILGGIDDVSRSEPLSDNGRHSIALAEKNARRMLTLVNQLLDFRKIVKERMELHIRPADLVPIARSVTDDFKDMAVEHHIELLFSVTHQSLMICIDAARVEAVIYNLLSNAFKFTPERGRIEVEVSHTEGSDMVFIRVKDSGIGIPKEKQQMIFERFTQLGEGVDPNVSGSGIGLAICKEIAEMHHGSISVESHVGEGSVFTVILPVEQPSAAGVVAPAGDDASMKTDPSDKIVASTGPRRDLEPAVVTSALSTARFRTDHSSPEGAKRILIVEDNAELRIFLYNHLAERYRIDEAGDGRRALAKMKEHLPDLIVTDLMMPVMDGIELVDSVRRDFATSHIPIIMITARDDPQSRIDAMRYGADAYITKPFGVDLLSVRIENLLTQRRTLFEKYALSGDRIMDLSPAEIVITDRDVEFMRSVMEWIERNVENPELTIDQLAAHTGMGRTSMYNKIKGLTEKSPVELIREYRLSKARTMLLSGQYSVSEVAYKVGFSDAGYFSKCFKEIYKSSPVEVIRSAGKHRADSKKLD